MKRIARSMSFKVKSSGVLSASVDRRAQAEVTLQQRSAARSIAEKHGPSRDYDGDSVSQMSSGMERLRLSPNRRRQRPLLAAAGSVRQDRRGLSSAASSDNAHARLDVASLSCHLSEKQIKNVVVMAGAGISTASGIPDFRTPGTGLYDNLRHYNLPYPEAVFDIEYFAVRPKAFFTLAKELLPDGGRFRPNYVHYFLRALYEKGVLLRVYTQNIDGLERLAGVPSSKLVEAHGTFATATCTLCGFRQKGDLVKADILLDKVPRCRVTKCRGIMKPDIVFFGENLPQRFYLHAKDFPAADLVIIMGTSLEVEPFAGILQHAKCDTPRLLINRELVGPFKIKSALRQSDVTLIGDLVENVQSFSKMLGWDDDISRLMLETEPADKLGKSNPASLTSSPTSNCVQPTAILNDSTTKLTASSHPLSCPCLFGAKSGTSSQSKDVHVLPAATDTAALEAGATGTTERTTDKVVQTDVPVPADSTLRENTGTSVSVVSARKFWMDSVAPFKLPQPSK